MLPCRASRASPPSGPVDAASRSGGEDADEAGGDAECVCIVIDKHAGSFRFRRRHHRSGKRAQCATHFLQASVPNSCRSGAAGLSDHCLCANVHPAYANCRSYVRLAASTVGCRPSEGCLVSAVWLIQEKHTGVSAAVPGSCGAGEPARKEFPELATGRRLSSPAGGLSWPEGVSLGPCG
jgi:hypothetical protein